MAYKLPKVENLLQKTDKWSGVKDFVTPCADVESFDHEPESWLLHHHIDKVDEIIRAYISYTRQDFDVLEEG